MTTTISTKAAKKKISPSKPLTVEAQLPLVEKIATLIFRRLPRCVELEDLTQVGVIGLMDALKTFNPLRRVAFATYASRRIHGQIMDYLRELDFRPRLVERRVKQVESARRTLQQNLGRNPSPSEMETTLSHERQREAILRDGRSVYMESLADPVFAGGDRSTSLAETLVDRAAPAPVQRAHSADLLHQIDRHLTKSERFILRAYFLDGLTLKEVGRAAGFSESRASQMVSSILARLGASEDLRRLAGVPRGPRVPLCATSVRLAMGGKQLRKKWSEHAQGWLRPDRQGRRRTEAEGRKNGQTAQPPAQDGLPSGTGNLPVILSPLTLNPAQSAPERKPEKRRIA